MSLPSSHSNCLDPLESMLDLSEYETVSYQSPSISPSTSKSQFSRPMPNTPATLPSSKHQALSGPSHQYDLYRQQTGIPQGAIANTLAVNSSNIHISQYGFSNDFLTGLSPGDEFVDFGTAPRRTSSFNPSDIDMEYESPNAEPAFFYPEQASSEFIDPSAIGGSGPRLPSTSVLPTQSSSVGRLWPGMHQQQAALAKAQAQQKQQQQIIQQQRQNAIGGLSRQQPQRQRPHPPTDPIVEEKISQLLNSMRQSSVATDGDDANTPNANGNMSHIHRMRKDEEDMDEDERLLASEEGKKLSSKERRQLRNKVSARAFRSRRKEYIGQLEGEIAAKANENTDLRSRNRALEEENTRLSDLTRMLLSSPSFSGFLDTLSANSAAAQQATAAPVQQQQQQQQPQVENCQVRKDVNPYAVEQQMQQQQIGIAMIPEHSIDFSMLDLNTDGAFTYQPQVFSVLSIPDTIISSEILSGKSTSIIASFSSEDEKVELPTMERMCTPEATPSTSTPVAVDEDFDADPAFALFADTAPSTIASSAPSAIKAVGLFAGIEPEKSGASIELVVVDATVDAAANAAMAKVLRMCKNIDAAATRLEQLTLDL